MNKYILPIVTLLLGILGIVGGLVYVKELDFPEKDQKSCEGNHQGTKEGDSCAVWDGVQCRKGKVQGNVCSAQASKIPLVSVVTGLVLIIIAIVIAIIEYRRK